MGYVYLTKKDLSLVTLIKRWSLFKTQEYPYLKVLPSVSLSTSFQLNLGLTEISVFMAADEAEVSLIPSVLGAAWLFFLGVFGLILLGRLGLFLESLDGLTMVVDDPLVSWLLRAWKPFWDDEAAGETLMWLVNSMALSFWGRPASYQVPSLIDQTCHIRIPGHLRLSEQWKQERFQQAHNQGLR